MDGGLETMLEVLGAAGPAYEHATQLAVYGRFVGAWEGRVTVHRVDGTRPVAVALHRHRP
jgi:hypothetical protein